MNRSRLSCFLMTLLIIVVALLSTDPSVQARETAAPDARSEALLQHVVFIGASASDGWNINVRAQTEDLIVTRPVKFKDVFRASMTDATWKASSYSDFLFYTRPLSVGQTQMDQSIEASPTLVVGIDYLFWYVYGTFGPDGRSLRADADRLELLEKGIAQLERLQCPVVVGDIPDMSEAVGRILSPRQMPSQSTLSKANKRIRAWVEANDQAELFPLARLVDGMTSGESFSIGRFNWSEGESSELIQADQLHPTARGLMALNQQLLQILEARVGDSLDPHFTFEVDAMETGLQEHLLEQARRRRTTPARDEGRPASPVGSGI